MLESHKDVITKTIKDLEVLIASAGDDVPKAFIERLTALKSQIETDTEEIEFLYAAW